MRSIAFMYPYSYIHHRKGLLKQEGIALSLPSGLQIKGPDWYPFVMTFTDDQGFSAYVGADLAYTILYSFPHFDMKQGGSVYYQPDSPFYSSFYGAYVIQNKDTTQGPYGFKNNKVDLKQIELLTKYDQLKLVLPSLGCPEVLMEFNTTINNIKEDITLSGIKGWTRIDGTIITNSPLHRYKGHQQGYIQYGHPPRDWQGEDFALLELQGRVYVKYFEKQRITMVFYLMGRDQNFVEEWDQKLFSRVKIRFPLSRSTAYTLAHCHRGRLDCRSF